MPTKPTQEQAQLHLQVYDLRREARLRQARDWFQQNYIVETVDDAARIAAPGTEHGIFFGMVVGYWEQACALLNYGLLHEIFSLKRAASFLEFGSSQASCAPIPRVLFSENNLLGNLEKAARRYEEWSEQRSPGHIARTRDFRKQLRAKASAASSA